MHRLPDKAGNFDEKGNRKPSENLTRVSPGVYRNSQGKLVGSRGQSLGDRVGRPGAEIGRALGQAMANGQQPPIPIPDRFMDQYTQNQQSPGNMAQQIAQGAMPNSNMQGIMRDLAGQGADNAAAGVAAGQAGAAMGAFPQNVASQAGAALGAFPQYGQGRPLTQQERIARGIDPRDPNTYSISPNGQVIGTLMGWSPNPMPVGQALFQGGFQPEQRQQGNSIGNLLRRNG